MWFFEVELFQIYLSISNRYYQPVEKSVSNQRKHKNWNKSEPFTKHLCLARYSLLQWFQKSPRIQKCCHQSYVLGIVQHAIYCVGLFRVNLDGVRRSTQIAQPHEDRVEFEHEQGYCFKKTNLPSDPEIEYPAQSTDGHRQSEHRHDDHRLFYMYLVLH